MKRLTIIAASMVLLTVPAWAQRTVNEVRPLSANGSVEISNLAGSVRIVGGTSEQVEITGVLGKNVEELEIWSEGDELEIEVNVPRHADDLETELVIKMPATASVDVETVSASIDVDGITGPVELETVSGRVSVTGQPIELSAESVSGDITVADAAASTDIGSVSGAITVENGAGELYVESVSSNIMVTSGAFDTAEFETVSGTVSYAGEISSRGEYEFETVSGTIELIVPPGVSADFDVETFSGAIHNAIGPEARSTSQYTPQKELSFTAGSGGGQIYISTFSGAVRITTR
jgi:DUF4097 and DUF4098 domain-containing protein YvlB